MGVFSRLKSIFVTKKSDSDVQDDPGLDPRDYDFLSVTGDREFQERYREATELPDNRVAKRKLYDSMDEDFIKQILNMYAGDATQFNLKANATVWVESTNPEVTRICTELFKRLELEDDAYSIVRSVIKYGEEFDVLTYTPNRITAWEPINTLTYMIYGEDNILNGYSLKSETDEEYSLPWDFVPFVLKGEDRGRRYGTSMLDALVKINSKLMMMEDAATVYRILQIPDRDIFYIDCTGCSIPQAERRIKQVRDTVNKQRFLDGNKTSMNKKFKLSGSATGTMFVPIFQDRQDRMEKQSSQSRVQDVYDLEYFFARLSSTAGVPPSIFGIEAGGGVQYEANKSLVMQDVRYARMIKRPQRSFLRGILTLCEIELCLHDIDPTKKENAFKVAGDPISFLEELQRQDLYEARLGVVSSFAGLSRDLGIEGEEWAKYLLVTFGGFTPEMVDLIYGSNDSGDSESTGLTEKDKLKLREEYDNNKVLQKKLQDVCEKMQYYTMDAVTRAEERSKVDSSLIYLPFMDKSNNGDLFDWREDTIRIRKELNSCSDNKTKVKLQEELDKYKKGSYNLIRNNK